MGEGERLHYLQFISYCYHYINFRFTKTTRKGEKKKKKNTKSDMMIETVAFIILYYINRLKIIFVSIFVSI